MPSLSTRTNTRESRISTSRKKGIKPPTKPTIKPRVFSLSKTQKKETWQNWENTFYKAAFNGLEIFLLSELIYCKEYVDSLTSLSSGGQEAAKSPAYPLTTGGTSCSLLEYLPREFFALLWQLTDRCDISHRGRAMPPTACNRERWTVLTTLAPPSHWADLHAATLPSLPNHSQPQIKKSGFAD